MSPKVSRKVCSVCLCVFLLCFGCHHTSSASDGVPHVLFKFVYHFSLSLSRVLERVFSHSACECALLGAARCIVSYLSFSIFISPAGAAQTLLLTCVSVFASLFSRFARGGASSRASEIRQHPSEATMPARRRRRRRRAGQRGDAISVLYSIHVSQTAFVSLEFRLKVSSVTEGAVIPSSFCPSGVI